MTPQDPLHDRLRALAELYEEEMPDARSEQIAARAMARVRSSQRGADLAARRILALSAVGVFALIIGLALGVMGDRASVDDPVAGSVTVVGSKYSASQEQLRQALQLLDEGRTQDAVNRVLVALSQLQLPSTAGLTVETPPSTAGTTAAVSTAETAAETAPESQSEESSETLVLRLAAEHLLRVIETVDESGDENPALVAELEEAAANLTQAAADLEGSETTTTSSTTTTTTTSTTTTQVEDGSTTTTTDPGDDEGSDPIILPPQP